MIQNVSAYIKPAVDVDSESLVAYMFAEDRTPKSKTSTFGYIFISIYIGLFLIGLFGNFLVIYFLVVNKRVKSMTNKLLINLSMADLLVVLVCIPVTASGEFYFNQWELGRALCYTTSFVQGVSVSVSVLTLTTISIDRYFIICSPMKVRSGLTGGRAKVALACVWVLSALIMSPLLLVFRYQEETIELNQAELVEAELGPDIINPSDYSVSIKKCFEVWPSIRVKMLFEIFLFGTLFIVPAIVMAFVFYNIAKTLWFNVDKAYASQIRYNRNVSTASFGTIRSLKFNHDDSGTAALREETAELQCERSDSREFGARSSTQQTTCGSFKIKRPKAALNSLAYQLKVCENQNTNRASNKSENNQTAIRKLIEGRKRVVKLVILLTCLFLVSWLPYHFISLILDVFVFLDSNSKSVVWTQSGMARITRAHIYPVILCLALANSAANPFIYVAMTPSFCSLLRVKLGCVRARPNS